MDIKDDDDGLTVVCKVVWGGVIAPLIRSGIALFIHWELWLKHLVK